MVDVRDRVARCRGMEAADIEAEFAAMDQDEVTKELVELLGGLTDVGKLPKVPYTVQLTMYGDADVSDWLLRYDGDGYEVVEAEGDEPVDLRTRWEHWEDAIRLLNGDVAPLSLLYARRIAVGAGPSPEEPAWFRAVHFAATSDAEEHGRVLAALGAALQKGPKALAAVVSREGIPSITQARALVVGRALVESGCAAELEGSYMRMVVPTNPPVIVQTEFAETSAATSLRSFDTEPPASDDDAGVTLRYASADAIVAAASGEMTFQQLLVNGLVKIEGPDERRERFGRALMKFAQVFSN